MPKHVQFIGEPTSNADTRVGLPREITVDTSRNTIRVHDGGTAGGHELALADATNIPNSAASTWRNALALSVLAQAVSHKLNGTVAPTTSNDTTQGYTIGSMWIDTVLDKVYICTDNTASAALWRDITNVSIDLTPYATNTALTVETNARTTADTTLQTNITAEATARTNADTTLQNNINAEVTARQTDTAGRALVSLTNVSNSDFSSKAAAAGVGSGSAIQQSGIVYIVSGGTTTISGKAVMSVNEQLAGQAFDLTYNTRADYIEQDAVNGTDSVAGTFTLHNQGVAGVDANTSVLIHADGVNGSTEVIDERGITPFGTHCAYFDGTSYFTVPSSYKTAFGSAQNFTYEGWANFAAIPSARVMLVEGRASSTGTGLLTLNFNGSANKWSVFSNGSEFAESGTSSPAGAWLHWALVRYNGTTTLYVGGSAKVSFADTVSYIAAPIRLGAQYDGGAGMTGWIDQFRVSNIARYTTTFTPPTTEFVTDANTVHLFSFNDGHGSQFIRDSSKSGHEIQLLTASISTAQSKFGVSSASIAGSGGIIVAPTKAHADFALGANDFTISFWVRTTTTASDQCLFHLSSTAFAPKIQFDTASGQVKVYLSSNNSSFDLANGTNIGALSANTWTHIALTRSGSSVYGFVGGVLGATISVTASSITSGLIGCQPYLGFNSAQAVSLNGYLDEVHIKRGQALWTTSFAPAASASTADDYTILLCHFDGAASDKATLDSSESSYGANAFGDTSTPVLSFAGSATLSTTYTRGGNSTSLQLNGTSQYASIQFATPSAGHPLYFSPSDKFCIEGWFYNANFTGGNQRLFNLIGVSNGTSTALQVYLTAGGVPTFGTSAADWATGPAATTGWNHYAVVREGRGYAVYTNGVAGSIATPQNNPSYASEAYVLYLGAYQGASAYLNGGIDSFRITHGKPRYEVNFTPGNLTQDADTALLYVFNGSVGQKWVKELSKNTALIQSVNARTVKDGRYIVPTLTGANITISTSASKFGTGSLTSSGTAGNYYSLPFQNDFIPSGDFTFEAWIKPASTASDQVFASKVNAAGTANAWQMVLLSGGTFRFDYVDTAGASISASGAAGAVTTSAFYHVAAVRTSGQVKLYVNGTQSGSTVTATNGMKQETAGSVFLGGNFDNSIRYNGYVDELRFSKTARWSSNFTAPTIPYGSTYATGPYYVTTSNTSQINLSGYSDLYSTSVAQILPPGTSIKYLVSFDARSTWKYWTGSAFATSTLANIDTNGNDANTIQAGLLTWTPALGSTLDVAASLKTSNTSYSPVLDNVTVTTTKYNMLQPVVDFSAQQGSAFGVQTLTVKRLKAGNANHVINYI